MMVETILSRSVRLVCAGGMALGVSAAFAQEAQQPMQKVEVTGSRIPTANLEGTSPITVLGSKDIKVDGVRNVENLLNNLPQVFASQSGNVVNGASGTATVNLRGLGDNRTLVLVNGKRLPSGSAGTVAADLNQIPTALVKRVEVLTGGAGAVYGADAVAGVVNFIMEDKFEGVRVDVNYSGYNHSQKNTAGVADIVAKRAQTNPSEFKVPGDKDFDGIQKDASILIGGNFDNNKGNATLFFSYKRDQALLQSERDFTSCSLSSSAAGFACGGSGTNATGRFTNTVTGKVYTVDASGNPRAFSNATDQYNFGPINHLQRPDERYGFTGSVKYDVTDKLRVYGDFAFHDDKTDAQIAPGGIFGNIYTIRYDNPFLTPALRSAFSLNAPGDETDIVINRRNVEGGGRDSFFNNTSFRTLLGVKGEIGPWQYDVFAQTAKVRSVSSANNYFSKEKGAKALDIVNVNGVAQCASFVNGTDPNCVPYNVFRVGGVTKAMLDYIQIPGQTFGSTEQTIQGANIAADLGEYGIKLPTSSNGIGVSFGVERRTEEMNLNPDGPSANFDLDGAGGPVTPVHGKYTVRDVFGEVRLPILEDKPFAKMLAMNGSFRHTNINHNTANTYGVGLEWAPVDMFKVRGSYQKAVRAPNIVELFSPAGNNLFDMDEDPCAGATPTASAAACARTGVTAAQYGKIQDSPAGQYNFLAGGNTKLKPETSKSKTVGLVLTPMPNLSFTLDYFDIKVEDTISTVSPETTLTKCLATGDAAFCSKVHRDSLGTLWLLSSANIEGVNTNIGSLHTRGIDLGANYTMKLPNAMGRLGFAFNGTILDKFEVEEIPGEGTYDCAGLYNGAGKCGQPRPEWRHKLRATWSTPWSADIALTWRHFGSSDLEKTSDNPLLKGNVNAVDRTLPKMNYLDLYGSYALTRNITVAAGINNLLDKDPPITSQYGTGQGNVNTFPSMYDAMGRKIFLNMTAKF